MAENNLWMFGFNHCILWPVSSKIRYNSYICAFYWIIQIHIYVGYLILRCTILVKRFCLSKPINEMLLNIIKITHLFSKIHPRFLAVCTQKKLIHYMPFFLRSLEFVHTLKHKKLLIIIPYFRFGYKAQISGR